MCKHTKEMEYYYKDKKKEEMYNTTAVPGRKKEAQHVTKKPDNLLKAQNIF